MGNPGTAAPVQLNLITLPSAHLDHELATEESRQLTSRC